MPILTGTIDDVTGSPLPDRVPLATLRVTVRAPSRRSSLTEQARLVASVPVPVEVSPTGEISVELEPGPAVMLVEGEGLRDVYELGVTADMTLLTEALQEMSPTRSWVESQMVQLRAATVTAASEAQTAKSDAEGAASVAEGHRTHVDAIRQTLDEAAQSNVAPYLTQTELNATYERARVFDVRNYGAWSEDGPWTANRDALQAANNACYAAGGGTVAIPPGRFPVKGVFQDSHVTIDGPAATLVHPDGQSVDIIRSRVRTTTGSIASGSLTLTVANATGIEQGCFVAVRGAGGQNRLQASTFSTAVTASQTAGLTLTSATGFALSGLLLVESELIGYTGLSGATLTGVTRGMYGTTPADHSTTEWVAVASVHIATVASVSGTTITLDGPAPVGSVTDATVFVGILSPGIGELSYDGQRIPGGSTSNVYPWRWDLVRWGTWGNVHVKNAEAAHYFSWGTSDCRGALITASNCSVPEGGMGAVAWYFQRTNRNRCERYEISDGLWAGVYYDNRTTLATEWDGPCNKNSIGTLKIDTPYLGSAHTNSGWLVVGGNDNIVEVLELNGVRTGFTIENSHQAHTPTGELPSARGNRVLSGHHETGYQPWVIHTPGNLVMGFTYNTVTRGTDTAGTLVLACAVSPGGAPTLGLFPDGVQSAPGVAFGAEPNTGLWRVSAGNVFFVSLGQLVARLRPSGLELRDGKDLEIGTVTGTRIGGGATAKIGFWGKAPVTQPAAVADATDAASTQARLNDLLARLRSVGIIA